MYEAIKGLGQNFLTDINIVKEFVGYLNLQDGDTVVEIGAGLGILTQEIAEYSVVKNITCYAVEIDQRFVPKLNEMFVMYQNIIIVEDDVLRWLPEFNHTGVLKIIGALPFYITSPILHRIIKMQSQPDIATILVQKEVAEKICALAPDSSYLSIFTQTFYDVAYCRDVARNKFSPSPNVDGAIITLRKNSVTLPPQQLEKYEGFLHKGFSSPRKMLNKPFTREELALGKIDPTFRPEALSAEQWFAFYKILHNIQS